MESTFTLSGSLKPNYTVHFHGPENKAVGTLDFNSNTMVFTGNAEESAKVFLDWVDRMFQARLQAERQAEREAIERAVGVAMLGADHELTKRVVGVIRARGN